MSCGSDITSPCTVTLWYARRCAARGVGGIENAESGVDVRGRRVLGASEEKRRCEWAVRVLEWWSARTRGTSALTPEPTPDAAARTDSDRPAACMRNWSYPRYKKQENRELGLDSMNNYIARRQLRWLGHVSRMYFDRLPRRMLSSWFPAPRCTGATKMTYGRTMKKAMATFDINPQNWYELAADREKWHAMIK